jgi:tetratricopeptide (TPR) repeat protein
LPGLLWLGSNAFAQEHQLHRPTVAPVMRASEQLQQNHFALAAQSARNFLNNPGSPGLYARQPLVTENAAYTRAIAGLKTGSAGSEAAAIRFVNSSAHPAFRQRVAFALAQFYFLRERLEEAVPYYELAGIANLSNEEIADQKFELAYCYFNLRRFDQAASLFASIKEVPGKYYIAGNYYYGLLAYNQGRYEQALRSFRRIAHESQYKRIVPYYVAEIHYFMGDRKQALAEAERLIQQPEKLYYDKELHLLAAQSLFEEQQYAASLPYFEYYYEQSDRIRKEELYEMGYAYYKTEDWASAIDKLKPLSLTQDSLGQTAMYLLGDCYLKTGDKKGARSAFGICANMPYNPGQREAALLLHARLSYELGYAEEAISSITTLLQDYPGSAYRTEARTLLSDLLSKSNNYEAAFETLQAEASTDPAYRRSLQKASYGFALKQMQQGDLATADSLLALSLQQPVDASYEAAAWFWRSDIAYRQQRHQAALDYGLSYLASARDAKRIRYISPQASAANAYLNMGYAAMALEQFDKARDYFSQAAKPGSGGGGQANEQFAGDALLRQADAAFKLKDFNLAASLYDQAIAAGVSEADYARQQKSILLGLRGRTADKISILQQIIAQSLSQQAVLEARYELANTYLESDQYQQAIEQLQQITGAGQARSLGARAWLKTGFAWQQLNDADKAIAAYRRVVTDYADAPERAAALEALENLYIARNEPAAYASLLSELGISGGADETRLESTYYAAAESQFASGKWQAARQGFSDYLDRYPQGASAAKARYYLAESLFNLKEYPAALQAYDALLSGAWTEFSEAGASRAAAIALQQNDLESADRYYRMMRSSALDGDKLAEAYAGLMRVSSRQNQPMQASAYADTLLSLPSINEAGRAEARFYQAKAMQASRPEEALAIYQQLTGIRNGAIAAEARYQAAAIHFAQNRLKEAEAAANQTISQSGGYDYWIVKSYILLADIMTRQKDYFNARATLQSVLQHTKIEELKQEATSKLEAVRRLERNTSKLREE